MIHLLGNRCSIGRGRHGVALARIEIMAFMFHRLVNLVTMMYNEQEELTVCHFIRPKERERLIQRRLAPVVVCPAPRPRLRAKRNPREFRRAMSLCTSVRGRTDVHTDHSLTVRSLPRATLDFTCTLLCTQAVVAVNLSLQQLRMRCSEACRLLCEK